MYKGTYFDLEEKGKTSNVFCRARESEGSVGRGYDWEVMGCGKLSNGLDVILVGGCYGWEGEGVRTRDLALILW